MVITCDNPTPNHASGHALLHKYDTDKDGTIAMPEMMSAVADLKTGNITTEESEYVTACWKLGAGGIDKMCPPRRPPCGDYGDIDGDGYVTPKDSQLVVRHVAFGDPLTAEQKQRADVKGDGKITAVNAMLIAKYALHVYDTFPVCKAAPLETDCSRCDFNRDGYVNYDDVAVIKAAYDSRPGDSNWNPDADLNGDGIVNYKDLGILTKCWGPVATPPEIEPVPEPAAKRLTYEESLERVNAGLPVYIKFDIPVLDQIPGMQWGPGIPILPGFMLASEP